MQQFQRLFVGLEGDGEVRLGAGTGGDAAMEGQQQPSDHRDVQRLHLQNQRVFLLGDLVYADGGGLHPDEGDIDQIADRRRRVAVAVDQLVQHIGGVLGGLDGGDALDELIDRYGDPPPSVSDLVSVSLVRVQAAAVGVYEVTQKKDTLLLQVETLDVGMIRGLLIAFNGRVTAGAGTKPYLSVVLQPDEKPLELLQSILRAMADILAAPQEEASGKK